MPRRQAAPALAPVDLTEVVRLYGLRNWVEQSYKQVKGTLGWSAYQVRKDAAIRRHWALVCCAFSFCWWADSREPSADGDGLAPVVAPPSTPDAPAKNTAVGQCATLTAAGGKSARSVAASVCVSPLDQLAGGAACGAGVVGALDHARALLARLDHAAAAAPPGSAARLGWERPSHPAL